MIDYKRICSAWELGQQFLIDHEVKEVERILKEKLALHLAYHILKNLDTIPHTLETIPLSDIYTTRTVLSLNIISDKEIERLRIMEQSFMFLSQETFGVKEDLCQQKNKLKP